LTGSAKDQLATVCSFCPAENKGLNSCSETDFAFIRSSR
jgi:hypothetical protein